MNDFVLIDEETGNKKHFDTRSEAESMADELGLDNYTVEPANGPKSGSAEEIDERTPEDVEVIDMGKTPEETNKPDVSQTEADMDALDQLGESLETDPLSILPSHMVDNIKGQPAINKRGYAMIAERYGVEVKADIVQFPWENEENRAVAKATAVTEDGKEYQDWATASVEDDDMEEQLIELASTRALKRCVGWATGLGIVSYQELSSQLEDAV